MTASEIFVATTVGVSFIGSPDSLFIPIIVFCTVPSDRVSSLYTGSPIFILSILAHTARAPANTMKLNDNSVRSAASASDLASLNILGTSNPLNNVLTASEIFAVHFFVSSLTLSVLS